ncbi:MAG: stage V sporulation protein AD [Firmicutes bacterium HGW-Firmicutes-7]|nr:MAG: stage V sporulation protein AD [Firmicutes bacterium HGW-Firmicutes-7]
MGTQVGTQTIKFDNMPKIVSHAAIVGPKEGEGPLASYFDQILEDVLWGEDSWEKAESKILKEAVLMSIKKASLNLSDIRYIFSGDLLSQLIGTSFALRPLGVPFFGVYGACSTMGESLILAAMTVEAGFADYCLATTSSHFCGAEKQFRFPLEYGSQRPPTSTWTVTGSGAVIVSKIGTGPKITYAIPGKIVDLGAMDPMDMGAVMAPAAADTIVSFFKDTGKQPSDLDLIATGDLGKYGSKLLIELVKKEGYDLTSNYIDCGMEIFDSESQNTLAGGSGCGCSAVTLAGYILEKMEDKEINKLLFVPTGAMLSTVSSNEGESIPGIAHGVVLEN